MCNGQSHFHINSLHPEGKSSPSSWIKGLLYCIKLPVSLFSYCMLFFLTLSTWPKLLGQFRASERSNWTLLWVTSMRRCPLTLTMTVGKPQGDLWDLDEMRGDAWGKCSRSSYHVSTYGRQNLDCIVLLSAEVSKLDKMPRHLSPVQLPQMVKGTRLQLRLLWPLPYTK